MPSKLMYTLGYTIGWLGLTALSLLSIWQMAQPGSMGIFSAPF